MEVADLLSYVRSAATLQALPLDDERARRVASHLVRTAALARQLEAFPLSAGDEPAQIYSPAPFPSAPDANGVA